MLSLVQVPEHGDAVLATGSGEGTVGRNGDGVDVSCVSIVVGLQLELGKFPDLDISASVIRLKEIRRGLESVRDLGGKVVS